MDKKLWFKAKRYGWGWVPCSYEGWSVLGVYMVFLFLNFLYLDSVSHSASDTIRPFIIRTCIATATLLYICYKKGEKPKWRWGR